MATMTNSECSQRLPIEIAPYHRHRHHHRLEQKKKTVKSEERDKSTANTTFDSELEIFCSVESRFTIVANQTE